MERIIEFLKKRRSIVVKKMTIGKVYKKDLNSILQIGTRVPDHGNLKPWKIKVIQGKVRKHLDKNILLKEFKKNNSNANKKSLSSIGVPNLAKTAPKKLDAATKTIIKAEISNVFIKPSCNFENDNFLYTKASNKAPIAPQPAASVGVANPNKILPRAAKTKAAGGTKPKKNSIQTNFMLLALISTGNGGPSSGFIQHLIVVYAAYKLASKIPGIIAAANKSITGISIIGPITTSMMLGGIKIPKVPPAVIVPAAN